MWTKKGKYGLKAMLYLAGLPYGKSALIANISAAENIPRKFLETILVDLRHGSFVTSRKGRGGGYRLALPPDRILVGELVRILDGPTAPLACASESRYQRCDDCHDEETCIVRLMSIQVRDAIAEVLDELSLEQMRERTILGPEALVYHV
jgi:Rrf2 family protein